MRTATLRMFFRCCRELRKTIQSTICYETLDYYKEWESFSFARARSLRCSWPAPRKRATQLDGIRKQSWTDYACPADKHLTKSSPLSFGGAFLTDFSLGFSLSSCVRFFYFRFWLVLSSLHRMRKWFPSGNFEHAQVRCVSHSWHMNVKNDHRSKFSNLSNRPFSKMAAENLNKSKLKMNTSTRKSTLTLVTLSSFSISG